MEFRSLLLSILLIFGIFVIPLNIHNTHADEIILFETLQRSGSDEVSTDNTYKERCWVYVQITIKSSHHDIHHRNNPDKTFYPADAFDYEINTWTEGCRHFQPCPLQSTNLIGVPNSPACEIHRHDSEDDTVGGTYGAASNLGTAVIPANFAGSDSASISKRASAEQYVCNKTGTAWVCGWPTRTASASYSPNVIQPNMEVAMETIGYEFTEEAGYISRNLDESYYVWDAINVVHNPLYKWKNDRVGTLFVEIEKIHDPLVLEDEFFCDAAFCVNTMEISGFLPWTGEFDYGGGNTVYNATSLDDIGEHEIKYIARLYNIAPQIDEFTQSIDEMIVEYEPIYEAYVYSVLVDDERLAIHDRMGIALHYFGSESTDANPDDETGIHEDRRSKINDYFYSTWGADPWEYELLDGTVADTDYSDSMDLMWDEAHDVGIITNELPVKKSEEISDQLIATEFPEIIPFEVEQHETANFVKAGYGKIKFDYPGLYDVLVDPVLNIPRFENATVFDTLQSSYFAGHEVTHLTNTEYMYPESFFYNTLSVTAVDAGGIQDDSIEIILELIPRLNISGTQYIDGYMHDKILFDTQDDGFSQIITGLDIDKNPIVIVNGHDIYTLDELESSGFGSTSIDKTRRILSSFTQYDTIADQTFANDDVADISDKYLLDTQDAILPIPLTTGLDALSPLTISITAYDGTNEITNTFDQTWYDFSVDYSYEINMDDNNVLNIKRDPANPRVLLYQYDENFGEIESLKINDITIESKDLSECFKIKSPNTCVVSVPQEYQLDELNIVATNMWSGKASTTLPEIDETQLNPQPPDPEHLIFDGILEPWIIIVLVFLLMVLVIFWIIRKYQEQ